MTTTIASNSDYWSKREDAERKWIAENLKNDEAFNARIQTYFDKALTNIQKDIDSEFAKYAAYSNDSMAGARRAVMATDVKAYQAEAKSIVDDARKMYNGEPLKYSDFSKDVNDRLKLYNATMRINRLEMLKSEIGQEMLDAHMKVSADLISKLSNDYQSEIKRQAGILGETVSSGGYTDLVKLLSKREGDYTFSQRIWINQDILKSKLDELLTAATIQGQSPLKIARKLRDQVAETVNNSRYVTERIARTESARIQTQAQLDSFHKFGYDYCNWVAEPSACDLCKGISEGGKNGKGIYRVDDVPDIPVHPNCRCSIAAYADEPNDPVLQEPNKAELKSSVKDSDIINAFDKTNIKEAFGDEYYEQFKNSISDLKDEQLRKLYANYGQDIEFANVSENGGNYARMSTVNLSNAAFEGDKISEPMQTVYHEIGHAIDSTSMNDVFGKQLIPTGRQIKKRLSGISGKMYFDEQASHLSGDPKINLGNTIKQDLFDYINQGEAKSPMQMGKKPRKKAEKAIWMEEDSKSWEGVEKIRQFIRDTKPTALENLKKYSDVSDMIEGTGYYGFDYPWNAGHGSKYWNDYGKEETEFFAEYTSARAKNPASLALIKEIFPNAAKICDSLIDTMVEAKK